jgi:hypothetical protein
MSSEPGQVNSGFGHHDEESGVLKRRSFSGGSGQEDLNEMELQKRHSTNSVDQDSNSIHQNGEQARKKRKFDIVYHTGKILRQNIVGLRDPPK